MRPFDFLKFFAVLILSAGISGIATSIVWPKIAPEINYLVAMSTGFFMGVLASFVMWVVPVQRRWFVRAGLLLAAFALFVNFATGGQWFIRELKLTLSYSTILAIAACGIALLATSFVHTMLNRRQPRLV